LQRHPFLFAPFGLCRFVGLGFAQLEEEGGVVCLCVCWITRRL
jgi:hypothetical protein